MRVGQGTGRAEEQNDSVGVAVADERPVAHAQGGGRWVLQEVSDEGE